MGNRTPNMGAACEGGDRKKLEETQADVETLKKELNEIKQQRQIEDRFRAMTHNKQTDGREGDYAKELERVKLLLVAEKAAALKAQKAAEAKNKELRKKLDDEDKKKLKKLFADLDDNKDGSLSAGEIVNHLAGAKDGEERTDDQKKAAIEFAEILTEKGVAALLKHARESEDAMTAEVFELWFIVNVMVPKNEAEAEAKETEEAAKAAAAADAAKAAAAADAAKVAAAAAEAKETEEAPKGAAAAAGETGGKTGFFKKDAA